MGLISMDKKIYANVLSDGKIRVPSSDNDPNAVRRDYELKDGTKGTKYELVYDKLAGKLTGLFIYEGDYGKTLQATIADDDGDIVLCLNMASNYADDFMKKLPNIDLQQAVELSPYSFEDDKGKTRKGISIVQNGEKVKNFFYDEEKKKACNGYPEVKKAEAAKYDSDDWKTFFIGARKFLVKYMEENILPKLPRKSDLGDFTEDELADDLKNINFNDNPLA